MYYVEFYKPRQGISAETFKCVIEETNAAWFTENPQDRPKLRLARTWRLGSGWPYITIIEIDSASRIDEWTHQRMTDARSRSLIEQWLAVVDCDAGLYDDFGYEQL
jgi:hypothetical protein